MNGTSLSATQLQLITITSCISNNEEIAFHTKTSSFERRKSVLIAKQKNYLFDHTEVCNKINTFITETPDVYTCRKQLKNLQSVLDKRVKEVNTSTTGVWAYFCRFFYSDQMKSLDQEQTNLNLLVESVKKSLNKIKEMKKDAGTPGSSPFIIPVVPPKGNSKSSPLQSPLAQQLFKKKATLRKESSLREQTPLPSKSKVERQESTPQFPSLTIAEDSSLLPLPLNIDKKVIPHINPPEKIEKPDAPQYHPSFITLSKEDLESDIAKIEKYISDLSDLLTPYKKGMNNYNKILVDITTTKDRLACFHSELNKIKGLYDHCKVIKDYLLTCENNQKDAILTIKNSSNKFPIFCKSSLKQIQEFYNIQVIDLENSEEETQNSKNEEQDENWNYQSPFGKNTSLTSTPEILCTPQQQSAVQSVFSSFINSTKQSRPSKVGEVSINLIYSTSKIIQECEKFIKLFSRLIEQINQNIAGLNQKLNAEKSDLTMIETSADFINGYSFQTVKRFIESTELEIAKFTRFKSSREQHYKKKYGETDKTVEFIITNDGMTNDEMANDSVNNGALSKTIRDLLSFLHKIPQQFEIALNQKKPDTIDLHEENELSNESAISFFQQSYLYFLEIGE